GNGWLDPISNSSERCPPCLSPSEDIARQPITATDGDRESLFQQGEQLMGTPCVLFAAFQLGDDFPLAAGPLGAVQHKTVSLDQEDESSLANCDIIEMIVPAGLGAAIFVIAHVALHNPGYPLFNFAPDDRSRRFAEVADRLRCSAQLGAQISKPLVQVVG